MSRDSTEAFLNSLKPLITAGDKSALNTFFSVVNSGNIIAQYYTAQWIQTGKLHALLLYPSEDNGYDQDSGLSVKYVNFKSIQLIEDRKRHHFAASYYMHAIKQCHSTNDFTLLTPQQFANANDYVANYIETAYISNQGLMLYFSSDQKTPVTSLNKAFHALNFYIIAANHGHSAAYSKVQDYSRNVNNQLSMCARIAIHSISHTLACHAKVAELQAKPHSTQPPINQTADGAAANTTPALMPKANISPRPSAKFFLPAAAPLGAALLHGSSQQSLYQTTPQ
jgi:hypothetical protein